nr:unnamed protein product [Digitaria exilis]
MGKGWRRIRGSPSSLGSRARRAGWWDAQRESEQRARGRSGWPSGRQTSSCRRAAPGRRRRQATGGARRRQAAED